MPYLNTFSRSVFSFTLIFVTDDSSLFHFIRKWNKQKEIPWWDLSIYLRRKKKCRFGKGISKMVVWLENVFKGTCGCSFHCLRNFVDKRILFGGHSMTLTHSSNRLLHKSVTTIFLIMSYSAFPAILWQILKSDFERKQSKTDYPKNIWKEEQCVHGFLGLGYMHFSEKKLQKSTNVLACRSS